MFCAPSKVSPLEEYFKHLARCYEGEVAMCAGDWDIQATPAVVRQKVFWNPQFAQSKHQANILRHNIEKEHGTTFEDNVDLRKLGSTTVIHHHRDGGHWRPRTFSP